MKRTHSWKRGQCVPSNKNNEKEINERFNYAITFLSCYNAGKKFVYIDEQSYNLTNKPYYGWERKGTALKIKRENRI